MKSGKGPVSTVCMDLTVTFIDDDGSRIRAGAFLSYDIDDPYAVSLDVRSGGASVRWQFARDLLLLGLTCPTGDGDVTVAPGPDSTKDTLLVMLQNPERSAVLEFAAPDVLSFLCRADSVVPVGGESDHLRLDEFLASVRTG